MKDFRLYMKPLQRGDRTGSLSASLHVPCKNGITLSVQAGAVVYSEPRRDLERGEDPTIYAAFEVALMDNEGEMFTPSGGGLFHDRPWAEVWDDGVGAYVSGHVIEMILKDIAETDDIEVVDWDAVWTDERYGQVLDEWQKMDGYE